MSRVPPCYFAEVQEVAKLLDLNQGPDNKNLSE